MMGAGCASFDEGWKEAERVLVMVNLLQALENSNGHITIYFVSQ